MSFSLFTSQVRLFFRRKALSRSLKCYPSLSPIPQGAAVSGWGEETDNISGATSIFGKYGCLEDDLRSR